jgi:hypothetical protein
MGVVRWLPLVLLLTACGSSGGGGAGGGSPGGDDGGGGAVDATASDGTAKDAAGGAMDTSTSDGTSDGTTTPDVGAGDATANDAPADAPGDGADGAPPPVCSTGATACLGSTPEICSGGQWVLADASCGGTTPICVGGFCGPCSPGTTGCVGNASAMCSSTGQWTGTVDCTATNQTCVAGTCTGMCAPGQTQCSSTGNGVQTCSPTGTWGNPVGCSNQTCVAGACGGTCAPGQTQCSGNGVETCDGTGNYGSPVDCGSEACFEGQCGVLVIAPTSQTIQVAYLQQSPTVQYTATINGNPVPASFAIDSGQIGSVASATGLMTPTGTIGGTAHVTATYLTQQASTPVTVTLVLTQNGDPNAGVDAGGAGGNGGVGGNGPGGTVGPGTVAILNSGAPIPDTGLAWLYPYDQTTWPQGLLPPLLQWQPGAVGAATPYYDAVRVQIAENGFLYTGYFAANAMPFVNIPIEQLAWNVMSFSNSGEPVTISLVFASSNGQSYGPINETWFVAPGTLQGTVYYNSYGTNLATNYCCTLGGSPFGGATLAIKSGATSPTLVAGTSTWPTNDSGCRVCHSVSADGSTLVTQHGDNYDTSSWYALATYAETPIAPAGTGQFAWPALFPNGSILLADGAPLAGSGAVAAQLFNTKTGAAVASTGIPSGLKAGSPVFSPDGTHVAFTFSGGAGSDGISLAAMDYSAATSTFSNFRVLYTPSNKAYTALWPSFMPTNDSVIFELQVQYNGRDWGGTRSPCDSTACANESTSGAQGQLWWVDLATKTAAHLAALDGLRNGSLYVPTSPSHANDAVLSFEPTVNPVASGGEAWIVFTTRRLYGNVATLPPYYSDPRYVNLTTQATPKKLWVAAMDLNAKPGTDPSHPAFYLPAQEILAGNSRGYWVVNPCQANGTSCQSGDECCGGYCEATEGGLVCGSQPPACSQLLDKCVVNSDCCGANLGVTCINGFCAQPTFTQ